MNTFFESDRDTSVKTTFDVLRNNNYPPHFHSNIELIYVLDGTIDTTINDSVYHLKKDDFMIIEPYKIHSYSSESNSTLLFAITPFAYYKELINPACRSLKKFIYPRGRFSESIKECFLKTGECVAANDQMVARGYLWAIIARMVTEYGCEEYPSNMKHELFSSLLEYLQTHYHEKITLDALSAHFGYNKYYISKIFNRYVNLNFSEFLNSMRCHHAAQLLGNKEISITNVAEESGFDSLRSFHRSFKKFLGCTPSEYRHKITNNMG